MAHQATVQANPIFPAKSPWWLLLAIYLVSVPVLALFARQVSGPLDIDSAYYFLVARNLAQGHGFAVDAVWHFFQPAASWPQPAGDLWMPLPSLLMVGPMLLGPTFRYAQAAQVLLAALLPLLAWLIAREEGAPPTWAGLAALATLLAGTVTVHWVDTDCYTAYAVVGAAVLWATGRGKENPRWLLPAGLLGGLAAITRNDGVLLLGVLWLAVLLFARRERRQVPWGYLLIGTALFLLPVLVWTGRNLLVLGRPSAVPLSSLLTLRDYNGLFAVQPQPDWAGFWRQGLATFLSLRLSALTASLTVLLGDFQGWGVIPLLGIALGLRRRPALWPAFLYLLVLWLALIAAFPLLVLHGTWSRSLTAFLPTGYACVALGVYRFVERLLRWRPALPARLLHSTFLALGALLIALVGLNAAAAQLGSAGAHPATWEQVGTWLRANSGTDEVIMAKDPMSVLLYGDRRAIGIPYEESFYLLAVARAYSVTKIVLVDDRGLAPTLQELYAAGTSRGPFVLLWKEGGTQVYGLSSYEDTPP
jgi:hypothetical protein